MQPATHVWTGGATLNNNWMNDNNWNIGAPNSADDVLVFPAGVSKTASDNNFPNGTSFNAIIIQGDGYSLRGNRVNLGSGGISADGAGQTANEVRLDLGFGGTRTIHVGNGDHLEISREISGNGGLTKTGTGTLLLSGMNSYGGANAVQGGVLEVAPFGTLGSTGGGVLVESLATLRVRGVTPLVGSRELSKTLTLQDNSRVETVANVHFHDPIILAGGMATIASDSVYPLKLEGPMSGPGGWRAVNNVSIAGNAANTYGGATEVGSFGLGATLTLNKPAGVTAIPGSLTIGTNTINASPAVIRLYSRDQIADHAPITIKPNGRLDLNGHDDAVGSLSMIGGVVDTEGWFDGGLTLNGGISATSASGSAPARIVGKLLLGDNLLRTIDVANGPAVHDLVINARVLGSAGIVKEGAGALRLAGNNTYTGVTTINAGILQVDGNQPNSAIQINAGATLAGRGVVGGFLAEDGGKVSPGDPVNPTAVLEVKGNAIFLAGSIFEVDLNGGLAGSGHDQLLIRSNLTGGASAILQALTGAAPILSPNVGPNSSPGHTFRVIDGERGVFGNFLGLPEGEVITTPSGVRLSATYQGGLSNDNMVLTHLNSATRVERLAVTPGAIDEGGAVTITGQLTDPDQRDRLTLQINWGDGSRVQTFHPGRAQFAIPHRYRDDGVYVVDVVWFDEHGEGNSRELTVVVNNVAPRVNAGGPASLVPAGLLVRTGTFVDPGPDSWTGVVDYGDGSGPKTLRVQQGFFLLQHRYQVPGTYVVAVAIADDDGGIGTDSFQVTFAGRPGQQPYPPALNAALDALVALLESLDLNRKR